LGDTVLIGAAPDFFSEHHTSAKWAAHPHLDF
jgi:hypothetical protein